MFRFIFFAYAVLAIAGCSRFAGLPDEEQAQLWAEHQQASARFNDWDLYARAVVRLEGEVYNLGIQWQREAGSFRMLLEAPFGQGVFRIESHSNNRYRLRLSDERVIENSTPEALLEDAIGWSLPISGLEYWIRGIPRPGSTYSHRLGAGGRARHLVQDQWAIDFLEYFEQPQLPRKIKLVSNTVTLKLIIERWQQAEFDTDPSDLFPEFN